VTFAEKISLYLISGMSSMTPPQLAENLKVSRQTVMNYCAGVSEPNISDAIRISRLLGFNLSEISPSTLVGTRSLRVETAKLERAARHLKRIQKRVDSLK
jgi:DNA-binding XRE family transcriptional regulator